MKFNATHITGRRKSFLQLSLAILIWASSFAITKHTVKEVPPVLFAFLRFVVASVVILLMGFKKQSPPGFLKNHFRSILLLALTGVTLYYLFFNISFYYTTAAAGSMIQGFIPMAVVILAVIFLGERINKFQVAGIVVSVIGVIVMAYDTRPTAEASSPLIGNLCMLASVFLWAGYTVISKKVSHADAIWLTTYSTIVGTILMIPAVIVELWDKPVPVISLSGWGSIIYLGVFASALSYYWYNDSLKTLKASTVGAFLNLDPVIGAVIAIIFLGEPVLVFQVIGVILVLTGVWINSKKSGQL